jgi:hypothetical protein
VDNQLLEFEKLYLGTSTDGKKFIRLDDWLAAKNCTGDLVLQMDIEGAEYSVLEDANRETLKRFRIIVIEFHNIDEWLTSQDKLTTFRSIVDKLIQDFVPVHVHPNNCCGIKHYGGLQIPRVLEFTFLRKDRFAVESRYEASLPNKLDVDNVPSNKPIKLTRNWSQGS